VNYSTMAGFGPGRRRMKEQRAHQEHSASLQIAALGCRRSHCFGDLRCSESSQPVCSWNQPESPVMLAAVVEVDSGRYHALQHGCRGLDTLRSDRPRAAFPEYRHSRSICIALPISCHGHASWQHERCAGQLFGPDWGESQCPPVPKPFPLSRLWRVSSPHIG
jgi:hypothetical protein